MKEELLLTQGLQAMHHRYVLTHEAERKQVVSHLNDTTIQSLLALHMQLTLMLNKPNTQGQTQQQLAQSQTLLLEVVDGLMHITRSLRPVELDTSGLDTALQQASESFSQLHSIQVNYIGDETAVLPEEAALLFFRLTQEAFTNIIKHVEATEVNVSLQMDSQRVTLVIEDNGCGFENNIAMTNQADATGLGLLHFMVLFQQLNGQVIWDSVKGEGTRVTAVLPISTASPTSKPEEPV